MSGVVLRWQITDKKSGAGRRRIMDTGYADKPVYGCGLFVIEVIAAVWAPRCVFRVPRLLGGGPCVV